MPIQAINAEQVRMQSSDKKSSALPGVGFSDYIGAASAPAATAVGMNSGYTPAAVTQAAVTGFAGGANTMMSSNASSAPYYSSSPMLGTATTPFGAGGYDYGGTPYSVGGGVGTSIPGGGNVGVYGSTGAPSQDYQEKQALFQQMNDANWEMLVAQVTVNDLSRDYQARSNILKSKSDAEVSTVRNMKT